MKHAAEFVTALKQMPDYLFHGSGTDAEENGRVDLTKVVVFLVVFVIHFFSKVVGSVLELPDTERIIEELIASHDGADSISENSKTCNEEKKTR